MAKSRKEKERDNLSKLLGVDLSQVEAALNSGVPTNSMGETSKPVPQMKGLAALMAQANKSTAAPPSKSKSEQADGDISGGNPRSREVASPFEPRVPPNSVVLACGGTDWEVIGRKDKEIKLRDGMNNLPGPTIVEALKGKHIQKIFTGPVANHSVALDDQGRPYVWGLNDCGQLGLGKTAASLAKAPAPVLLPGISGIKHVAVGKKHTVMVKEDGKVLGMGSAAQGQLGALTGTGKQGVVPRPTEIQVGGMPRALAAAAGADFTMAVCEDGSLWSWGWSEFGQLGHGDDGEHNTADSSVKLTYRAERQPRRVEALRDAGVHVVQVSCGPHHSAAVGRDGSVWTWGSGDYGKLGHRRQEDLWTPTELEGLVARHVACGHSHNAAIGWQKPPPGPRAAAWEPRGNGSLFMWGQCKKSGDAWMYPKPEHELSGWSIDAISLGASHTVVAAEKCVISWGTTQCPYLQLGFGAGAPKSSVKPKKVDSLENFNITQVACGYGHTLWLAEQTGAADALPSWDVAAGEEGGSAAASSGGEEEEEEKEEEEEPAGAAAKKKKRGGGKRKTTAAAAPAKKAPAKRGRKKKA